MTNEARQVTPVEFYGGSRGITYAKGVGFNEVPEPTEAELAEIEAAADVEAQEPPAVAPVDAQATSSGELPPEPTEPLRPSPDDPEAKASPGKAARTPAKS